MQWGIQTLSLFPIACKTFYHLTCKKLLQSCSFGYAGLPQSMTKHTSSESNSCLSRCPGVPTIYRMVTEESRWEVVCSSWLGAVLKSEGKCSSGRANPAHLGWHLPSGRNTRRKSSRCLS